VTQRGTDRPFAEARTAVTFNSSGDLHLVASGDVFKLDPVTGARTLLLDTDSATDKLAFDSKNWLFVSMYDDNTVLELLPSGPRAVTQPARGSTMRAEWPSWRAQAGARMSTSLIP